MTDPKKFEEDLKVKYKLERDAVPDRKPSMRRVAERFGIDRRTFSGTLKRYDIAWPPSVAA